MAQEGQGLTREGSCQVQVQDNPTKALRLSWTESFLHHARLLVSWLFFLLLDFADFTLCYVFSGLDRVLGDTWGSCYCPNVDQAFSASRPSLAKEQGEGPVSEETSLLKDTYPVTRLTSSTAIEAASGVFETATVFAEARNCSTSVDLDVVTFSTSALVGLRKKTLRLGPYDIVLPVSNSLGFVTRQRHHPSTAHTPDPTQQREQGLNELKACPPRCLPEVKRARSTLSSSLWRTGLRWTDCSCTECRDPEADENRLLFVEEVNADATRHSEAFIEPVSRPEASDSLRQTLDLASPCTAGPCKGPQASTCKADVIFLHGFCSSSAFWGDTVVPLLSQAFKLSHRLLLVDLLGFGKSPKPRDCQYTIGEHAMRIEADVLQKCSSRRFHLVAHSMGCSVALALAARNPDLVQSITLYSPPFVPPSASMASPAERFFVSSAPKLLGAGMASGISVMAWYEHLGRLMCAILTKGHWLWEAMAAPVLHQFRIPTSFIRDFMRHTHHSAWHSYYNTICEGANAYPILLDHLNRQKCQVSIIHGQEDTLCSIEASRHLASQHENVVLQEVAAADHVTVVLSRRAEAAKEIEERILGHSS